MTEPLDGYSGPNEVDVEELDSSAMRRCDTRQSNRLRVYMDWSQIKQLQVSKPAGIQAFAYNYSPAQYHVALVPFVELEVAQKRIAELEAFAAESCALFDQVSDAFAAMDHNHYLWRNKFESAMHRAGELRRKSIFEHPLAKDPSDA
jgi:hypothetical protein